VRREVIYVHRSDVRFSSMKAARAEGAPSTTKTATEAAAQCASLGAFAPAYTNIILG